eukprot:7376421-Prymnesium_polylepis.2
MPSWKPTDTQVNASSSTIQDVPPHGALRRQLTRQLTHGSRVSPGGGRSANFESNRRRSAESETDTEPRAQFPPRSRTPGDPHPEGSRASRFAPSL